MEIKGIDVSSIQGAIDWAKVASSGIRCAILRVHQRSGIDSRFEKNYKGCRSNGIRIGVYKYSYAKSVEQAKNEAEDVLSVLNGRGLDYPVFYDLEWPEQRSLGKPAVINIAKAFLQKIVSAGYRAGIYCNTDWYNWIGNDELQYDFWLAAYPYSDNGTIVERLRPADGVGWQYSSKGKVAGITGNVDLDVFYTDYKEEKHMISNCGHDENNGYIGGKAGDQTGGEWEVRNWYNRPWNCVLRHPDQKVKTEIAKLAEAAAKNNKIGYDQGQRYTFWEHLKASNYDPAQITVNCEADCSSGVAAIVKAVGYRLGIEKLKEVSIYLYTGNMRAGLKAAGFEVLTDSKYLSGPDYLLEGDILLNDDHHVATNLTNGSKALKTTNEEEGGCEVKLKRLVKGSKGNQVKTLQRILAALGYKGKDGKKLSVDGKFGENTEHALIAFQKAQGFKPTSGKYGICAAGTWKLLVNAA